MRHFIKFVYLFIPHLILVAIYPPQLAFAAPPAPLTFWLVQPDGIIRFEARVWGDEHLHGTETVEGYTILQDPDSGYWLYARVAPNGNGLVATTQIVGQDPPPLSARNARPAPLNLFHRSGNRGPVGVGSVPVLVLMVQYQNHLAISTEADWRDRIFGPNNSIRDYYRQVSYNQLHLVPAAEACGAVAGDGITGWLTLGTTHPNAGGPSIARAALKAADACIDYASFDHNGDKKITSQELLPLVIVAGYEASYGGPIASTPNLWGHQSSVNYHSVGDGVMVEPYSQFGEWHANSYDPAGHLATIGLIVHEVGHLLGWPDLYDTIPPGNPDSEGVGEWSLMGSGLWLGAPYLGDTPAHPSAWEKWYQGWLTPNQLNGVGLSRTLPRVEDNSLGSVIQLGENPGGVDWSFEETSGTGEYFLVENRQQVGYDARLPGCGLLVWHIDEQITFHNTANSNENHKLVDLEEADGFDHLDHQLNRGDAGDPFPGSGHKNSFNLTSTPDSRYYDGQASGIAITNISPGCADTKTATFTTVASPELKISMTSSPPIIHLSTTVITYTLILENRGEEDATSVIVSNTIPLSTTYLAGLASDSGDETTPGSGIITWPPITVSALSTVDYTFRVKVTPPLVNGDHLVNQISVTSAEGISIDNFEQVGIVGGYQLHLPLLLQN